MPRCWPRQAFIPGVNTLRGALLVNGVANAALTEGDLSTRAKAGAIGAAAGAEVVLIAINGIAQVVRPEYCARGQAID